MKDLRKDLSNFFYPKSIAIAGVSQKSGGLGGRSFLEKYLEAGFKGRIYPLHPQAKEILGLPAYPSLRELPEVPDLIMIALPAEIVPTFIEESAKLGAKCFHILTAGFAELGTEEGRLLEEKVRAIGEKYSINIIGPNCMGPYCPASHLTAWGAIPGKKGELGVISQSGGITQRLTEYAFSLGLGVSKAVSIGNAACLDTTDFLAYLGEDEDTKIIALYIEGAEKGRLLFSLARDIAKKKPIVVLKGGKSERGSLTVGSHTGKMAGQRVLWEAFFRQTRAVEVTNINDWIDTILALHLLPPPPGDGVFIIGGGGGNSIVFADLCDLAGLKVPVFQPESLEKLKSFVPAAGSIAGNPLDFWETYLSTKRLTEILNIAYHDPNIHLVIIDRLIPRRAYHSPEVADYVLELSHFITHHPRRKPTVFTVDYDGGDLGLIEKGASLRRRFCEAGVPAYPSFERAAFALSRFVNYHLSLTREKLPLY